MESVKRLRRSNSTIFWTFPAIMVSYIIFLSSLGDVFDGVIRHNPFLAEIDKLLSGTFNVQVIALIAAVLLAAGALAFQAGASSNRFLRFVPLGCVMIPIVTLLLFWKCAFGVVAGEACSGPSFSGGWGNLVYPPFLLSLLVVAFAVSRSEVSERVQRMTLLPLGIVALGMVLQMVDALAWGIAAWPTDQSTVTKLALAYDRQLWPGDWHIWLVLGLVLVTFFGVLAIEAVWRGLAALLGKQNPAVAL